MCLLPRECVSAANWRTPYHKTGRFRPFAAELPRKAVRNYRFFAVSGRFGDAGTRSRGCSDCAALTPPISASSGFSPLMPAPRAVPGSPWLRHPAELEARLIRAEFKQQLIVDQPVDQTFGLGRTAAWARRQAIRRWFHHGMSAPPFATGRVLASRSAGQVLTDDTL